MRFLYLTISAIVLSFCGGKPSEAPTDQPLIARLSPDIPYQYVVVLKEKGILEDGKLTDGVRKNQYKRNNPKRKLKKEKIFNLGIDNGLTIDTSKAFTDVLVGFKARLTSTKVTEVKQHPDVEDIYPDFEIRLRNPIHQSEPIPTRNPIHQDEWDFVNWDRGITCAVDKTGGPVDASGKSTVVWVLDTGVQPHTDLNVETDPQLAVSFIPGQISDENGHGTHVAGIIGAYENDLGATGVSKGARVVPVKVLENSGEGRWSYLLAGLDHVSRYNSENDVVNLSLGAYGIDMCNPNDKSFKILQKALRTLAQDKTFIVIAAGNDSGDVDNSLPGCISGNNIFTVAAMDCDPEDCSDYSNFGLPTVDWIAIGSNVFSTYLGNEYRIMSGTSMATAVVSGVVHANGGPPKKDNNYRKDCNGEQWYYYARIN